MMTFKFFFPSPELKWVSGLCQCFSSTEGECSRSESGVMMRSGTGKYSSAEGVVYTGEWCEDKVCKYCVCVLHDVSFLWLLTCSLALCHLHRCMAQGPCSILLELFTQGSSKTTCTTAREHTLSPMGVLTKVTFT